MGMTGTGDGDVRLEHEHEVVELGAPFAQVFGPEIVDANLSDFEFRLLVYLRITAAANGSTWVSHKQMAKHLGKSMRSVKRAYSELLRKGFARSRPRSFGQTSKKILAAPSKVYGAERMRRFFKYLRSETTDEGIAFLRSEDLDNPDSSNGDKSVPIDDIDSPGNSSSDKNDPSNGDKNVPSMVPDLGTSRSRSNEVDQNEVDQSCSASHRDSKEDYKINLMLEDDPDSPEETFKKTGGDRLRDRWKGKPHDEESKTRSDSERQAAAQAAADEQHAKDLKKAKALQEGRVREQHSGDSRKAKERREARRLTSDASDSSTPPGGTGKPGPNAKDVEDLYKEKLRECYPGVRVGRWEGKESKHARNLLDDFGWDLVERVIVNLFDNWPEYGERMKNDSEFPSIGWIYAARQQLFGEIQKTKKTIPVIERATPAGRRRKQGSTLGE